MEIFASARNRELILHDLRTPLNVIKLVLQMIDDPEKGRDPEDAEGLATIRSSEAELERMLTHFADAMRLPRDRSELAPRRFDPRRLLDDVIADHGARAGSAVEFVNERPVAEVVLDYGRAKMAVEKVLGNVAAASGGKPVRVRLAGGPERCIVAFESDVPPKSTVSSHVIVPDEFQRILGTAGERRGLDLAIAGTISNLFGGTARLEATPGQGTAVILDWPSRIDGAGATQA